MLRKRYKIEDEKLEGEYKENREKENNMVEKIVLFQNIA